MKKLQNAFRPKQKKTEAIRVNQIGYLPNDCKCAVLVGGGDEFSLIDSLSGKEVYVGRALALSDSPDKDSQDIIAYADFSDFKECGKYRLLSSGVTSYEFEIKEHVYDDLQTAMLRALYYQRCGTALEEKYAGKYSHAACHCSPDTYIRRSSVVTETDDEFTIKSLDNAEYVDLRGGWHEAGDFSKNIISGALAAMLLMYGATLFPESFKNFSNIPESGNGVPDALNEARWELEFAMKLQNEDGGFSHIAFPWVHPATVMPEFDRDKYFVWQSSVESTGNGVMLMGMAARVYKKYDPEFAGKCIECAERGWSWLEANPENLPFRSINRYPLGYGYIIGSETETPADNRFAAACSMFALTGDEKYHTVIKQYAYGFKSYSNFRKGDLAGFGVLDYVLNTPEDLSSPAIVKYLKTKFLDEAKANFEYHVSNGYSHTHPGKHYGWASNFDITERSIKLIFAQIMDPSLDYHEAISSTFSYLLGANATDKCFVTGYGTNPFLHPHHRQCETHGFPEPIPGYVAGGCVNYETILPRSKRIPEFLSPDVPPLKSFADEHPFFMMTEVEVDWNTYPAFVAAYLTDRESKLSK